MDEDDDLQKALRASLMDAEGHGGDMAMGGIDDDDMLPEDVTKKYNKVVAVWERQRRILWYNVEDALTVAIEHFEHRQTQAFLIQMVKEIVEICGDCTWAAIKADSSTKEDFAATFENILVMCCKLSILYLRYGSRPPRPPSPSPLP